MNVLSTYSFLGLLAVVHEEDCCDSEERCAREREFGWARHLYDLTPPTTTFQSQYIVWSFQWRIASCFAVGVEVRVVSRKKVRC